MALGTALTGTGGRPLNTIFNFLSNTDVLVLQDSDVLDRENIEEYRFTVVADDAEGLTSTATVTVVVTDINDETPFVENPGSVGNTGLSISTGSQEARLIPRLLNRRPCPRRIPQLQRDLLGIST